jgi:hypothetical protein
VEWTDGQCHQERTRGPCPEGERLEVGQRGANCQPHACRTGHLPSPTQETGERDALCYKMECTDPCTWPVDLWPKEGVQTKPGPLRVKPRAPLDQLLSLQCRDTSASTSERGTITGGNCLVEAETDGTCLKLHRKQPEQMEREQITLSLSSMFEELFRNKSAGEHDRVRSVGRAEVL